MTGETPETIPARQRRRRYDAPFKRALVEQTLAPGASVARIAREHDINANQLFKWRRQFQLEQAAVSRPGALAPSPISLLPVTVVDEAPVPVAAPSPAAPAALGAIEVQLAGGTVRVQGAVDKVMLQLVLSSLRR
jgi:transposase